MKTNHLLAIASAAALSCCVAAEARAAEPSSCGRIAELHVPNLTITSATDVAEPTTLTGGMGGPAQVAKPFCRIAGYLTPTSDSHIGFEVWLPPAADWNHRFEAVGNGGFAGSLNYRAMVPGLSRGYATMTTDEGHINKPEEPVEDVSWALGHPEKFIDYAYRAEHVTTAATKQIIEAYYGSNPSHSFYSGCSAGGIQGMVEMLRYPKDFDGYIIGDATPDHLGQELGAFWNTLAASIANESEAFRPEQVSLIHKEALQQCVGKDGGASTDTFLSNPLACTLDTKPLACSAGSESNACLDATQVADLNKIFQGPVDSNTHKQILAGLTAETETTWDRYFTGKKNPVGTERPWAGFLAYVAYGDADYLSKEKYLAFNFGSDYEAITQKKIAGQPLAEIFDTATRDLDPVKSEGGKVIQYHGWEDPNIPSLEAVHFFEQVVADQAKRHHLTKEQALEETEKFYRLFMVPGMGHCAGGAGPNSFGQNPSATKSDPDADLLSALERWVDSGVAPEEFIGSRTNAKTHEVDMTRPVCPYPKTPVWNGVGDTSKAASFSCTNPSDAKSAQK